MRARLSLVLFSLAWCCVSAAAAEPPPIRVVYFVPSDRQPQKDYQERLDRVLVEVQRFYRDGMEAAGYGPKTFALDRDAKGRLRIDLVNGKRPMQEYGRNDGGAVHKEVKAALAAQGIDVDHQTLLIFQVLLAWEGSKAIEVGPYVGGGNHLSGTAWVYDDEKLDPRLLASKAPGGYYGRPCSLGEFNSHYIGGVAHELGHALGLPHDCQTQAQRSQRGLSLMGGGNHTYGQERRGQGRGTFLSPASAMLLAYSRPFAGDQKDAQATPKFRLTTFDADFRDGKLVLSGSIEAAPPVFGVAAFNDLEKIGADYDAVSWTSKVDDQGRFRLEIGEMRPGRSQLRLRFCHTNGTRSPLDFDYELDAAGKPRLDVFRTRMAIDEALAAYTAKNRAKLQALAADWKRRFPDSPDLQRKALHLLNLLDPPPPQPLASLKLEDGWAPISRATFRSATTGWGPPLRDKVPIEKPNHCLLQVDGKFFQRGLYAHAPARHELELGGGWSRFRSDYGLEDGHGGSVVFVVRGDGRELARSPLVKDHVVRSFDLDVRQVNLLELAVENGGDGTNGDWAVWLAPQVQRATSKRR